MPTPGEHKTVQARILAYAKEVGWAVVSREEAERRRGFNLEATGSAFMIEHQDLFHTLLHELMKGMVRDGKPAARPSGSVN